MYNVKNFHLDGIGHGRSIPELEYVHPIVNGHLKNSGYEVLHEHQAFRVPYSGYAIALRVDFLAFKEDEILIVECKGFPFEKAKIFGAILQLTLYMRLYRMLQQISNPQLLLEELDPKLIRNGKLCGALAIPFLLPNNPKQQVIQQTYQSLASVNLLEEEIEIWNLR